VTPTVPAQRYEECDQLLSGERTLVRCQTCWCMVALSDTGKHDEWHQALRSSATLSAVGFGGLGL